MRVVIALVAFAVRRVEGDVRHHALAHQLIGYPTLHQGAPIGGVELGRQRHGDLARHLGVLARLDRLDCVPERHAVMRPIRRPLGRQDQGGFDAGLAAVVVHFAGALVTDDAGRPIGGGGRGRAPRAPADH